MVTEASSSSPASPRLLDAARETLARATDHLLSLQHPEGWWKGELETNVTIDAEDVFLRRYLGTPGAAEAARRSAEWIRSRQRPDGTWATYFGGPGDLSTTVEAYVALRIAGDPPEAAHMRRAAAFGRWARQTIVALQIVTALRPRTTVGFDIPELVTGRRPRVHPVDRVLHAYARRPIPALRRRALAAAERWVVERQERDGSWGGIQPPWVWSMIALHARG